MSEYLAHPEPLHEGARDRDFLRRVFDKLETTLDRVFENGGADAAE